MAASRYRNFLRLCQNWPLDPTKEGRDLGAHIRKKVADAFKHGEHSQVDEVECNRIYSALEKLSTSHYKTKYPTLKTPSGALGLELEDCRLAMSTESLKEFDEMTKSYWEKMREFVVKYGNKKS